MTRSRQNRAEWLCIPLVRDDARPAALDDFLSLSSGDRPLYLPDEFLPLFGSRSPGNLLLFVLLDPLGVLAIHFVFKVTPWLDFSLVLFAEFTVADLFILPVEAVGCWFWASAGAKDNITSEGGKPLLKAKKQDFLLGAGINAEAQNQHIIKMEMKKTIFITLLHVLF
jgi:hypothetical protein